MTMDNAKKAGNYAMNNKEAAKGFAKGAFNAFMKK